MAIVTGDRYLDLLVRFVARRAGQLLDGSITLKLNPAGLHYVHSRLDALRELESLIAAAPVDYLRAYVSDLGDHRALEQLRRILRLLTSLKVISALPPAARDPTPLSLLPFARLRVLELRGCNLSTSAARGLLDLRHTLEKLICHNSTDALRHVFASRIADIEESPVWNRLSFVSCACNGMLLMDESLRLLPVVEKLDLSRNQFAKVDNLRMCTKLKYLDLGFNHLRSISCFSEVSCPIVKLVLRNNALTTLRGLEHLKSVEGLDLSYNIISNFSELEILASLPCLQNLWLEGNPICCARWFRAHVFSFFSHPEKMKLDEKGISTREYWERHIIFSRRQKQPAGYGFYFPAKVDAEDENYINTKKMVERNMSPTLPQSGGLQTSTYIEDDEQRRYICSDSVDQESISCDSVNIRKDENAVSDGDSEIVSLMNRVEFMKKERSDLWLIEFKEWLDQSFDDAVDGSRLIDFNLGSVEEKYVKQKKGRKNLGASSTNVPDTAHISDGENSSDIFKSDMYIGSHGNEISYTNAKTISELPMLNGGRVKGVIPEKGQLKDHSGVLQNPSPLEFNGPPNHRSSTYKRSGQVEQKISPAPVTAIDEIIGSRSSSLYPGSPPHYQEDILHRRLYLEEEYLQLSAGSFSVASSDSDTSCSDEDSCRFHGSNLELGYLLTQGSSEQGNSYNVDALLPYENNHDDEHEGACTNEICRNSPEHCSGMECLSPNQGTSSSPCDNLNDHSYEIDRDMRQDAGGTEKRKGKRKPKKRVALLVEDFVKSDTEVEIENPNATLDICKADLDTELKITFDDNCSLDSCEQATKIQSNNCKAKDSPTNDAHNCLSKRKSGSINPKLDDVMRDFFHSKIVDSRISETCQELVRCECISQLGSSF